MWSAGSSVITVNSGIDLRPGLVQMSVIYPASPLCSPASDYQTTSPNHLEISPRSSVLLSTDTDHQEVTGFCRCYKFLIKTQLTVILVLMFACFRGFNYVAYVTCFCIFSRHSIKYLKLTLYNIDTVKTKIP